MDTVGPSGRLTGVTDLIFELGFSEFTHTIREADTDSCNTEITRSQRSESQELSLKSVNFITKTMLPLHAGHYTTNG